MTNILKWFARPGFKIKDRENLDARSYVMEHRTGPAGRQ